MPSFGDMPTKTCGACGAVYEGVIVHNLHSCEACGAPNLRPVEMRLANPDATVRLPRSGGQGLITHTRDNF